ncbi:branched-chain amino acid ABC transporter permease [Ferruginivarius sediminum]|uniref:Branched-chain amino acid ABC transporter permease n=1 Tax=Ferruginivarius sediminum TaxID=2661937 RepID=A0A369T4D3_9PROT|nr:branched-chain amino acid ABC transporter permease [Ferruginivarius sediminum]RDD60179.1 branched-chain amino acid ABC transporter permease [Ferruginivarius sediminum]
MSARQNIALALGLLVVLAAIPLLTSSRYVLGQFILFFIWFGVVTQWNLVFGVAGIFSLAQMMIFAVGGYASAMLAFHLQWAMWLTVIVGGCAAVVTSTVIGFATLRLRGAYVALLTLAIAAAMQALIIADTDCLSFETGTCITLTGGASGLSRFGDFGFRELLGYRSAVLGEYYLGLLLITVGSAFAFLIINSPLGHAFRALRDNSACAAARGIDRIKYQVMVFSLAGFFSGLLGGFYAGHFNAIGPSILDFSTLLFLLTSMIVGGVGRFWGPLAGCAAMMLFDELLMGLEEWRAVGLGVFTVVAVILFPQGIVGFLESGELRRIGSQLTGLSAQIHHFVKKAPGQ